MLSYERLFCWAHRFSSAAKALRRRPTLNGTGCERDVTENKTNIKHLQEKRALVGSITALILFPILTGLIIKKWIDPRKVGERLDRPTAEDYQKPKSQLREVATG